MIGYLGIEGISVSSELGEVGEGCEVVDLWPVGSLNLQWTEVDEEQWIHKNFSHGAPTPAALTDF